MTKSRAAWYISALLLQVHILFGQSSLALSSGTAVPSGPASLSLTLGSSSGNQFAALEWTINYPAASITALSATAGAALNSSSKSLSCRDTGGGYTCIAAGMNANPIPDGVVATISISLAAAASGSVSLTLTNATGASAVGSAAPIAATSGLLNISPGSNDQSSQQQYVYVANAGSNTVAVVNSADNTISTQIPVPSGPTTVAITPDGNTLYVASSNVSNVSVINTTSRSITATISIPTGALPVLMAVNPNGSLLYVVDQGLNQITVISTTNNTVAATIPVGPHPNAVAFSPDGTRAYVTNQWSNNVSIIDTSANAVVSTFTVGAAPTAVAVAPNGSVYVGCAGTNMVEVHGASGNPVATISGFTYPKFIAITPDGAYAYVANVNAGSISVIATAANRVVSTIQVGSLPNSVAISTDGLNAYVTNEFAQSVSVISTATNSVAATIAHIGIYPISVATKPPTISM